MMCLPAARLPTDRSLASSLCYGLMVAALCIWVMSLPLFPSQDGAMHRYYVHVLDSLLQHQSTYSAYQIRHPFPPYATHYASMLLLTRIWSPDTAEKLFVCLSVILFAYGLRTCAKATGPSGQWVSLFAVPLVLPWALWMGFFNFYFASGLFLFAAAFWQLASRARPALWLAFAFIVLLLTITHPIPLLLLLVVCSLDLLLTLFPFSLKKLPAWVGQNRWRLGAILFVFCAFLYPASLVDKQHTGSVFSDIGLHPHFISSMVLLMGVSPYNTRSTAVPINLYRAALYLLLLCFVWLAVRALRNRPRAETFNRGSDPNFDLGPAFLLATCLLGIGLLFMPNSINGSLYFATRLISMLWIGSLIAASSGITLPASLRAPRILFIAGGLLVITLLPADRYLRPVARELKAEEMQSLPQHQQGVLLIGYGLQDYVRFHWQLAFNPFQWSTALAPTRHDDVLLDSPWMDQNITPLAPVAGGPLMIDDITDSPFTKINPPKQYGRSLPAAKEQQTVRAADFVIYAGAPADLATGLARQFDSDEAARFACAQHGWYLLCLSKERRISGKTRPAFKPYGAQLAAWDKGR